MDSLDFERLMVGKLAQIIEAKGLKHDPVAKSAWPYKKAAGRTWQAIRSPDTAQRFTLRDAYALAQFLGISLSQVCALVEGEDIVKNTSTQKCDSSPSYNTDFPPKDTQEISKQIMRSCVESVSGNTEKV